MRIWTRLALPLLPSLMLIATPAWAIVCPADFIEVSSSMGTLGCIQDDVERDGGGVVSLDFEASADRCFDDYGGRLPSAQEFAIAANHFALTSASGPVWTADVYFSDGGAERAVTARFVTGDVIDFGFRDLSSNGVLRCWIPAQNVPVAGVPVIGWLAFVLASGGAWLLQRRGAQGGTGVDM